MGGVEFFGTGFQTRAVFGVEEFVVAALGEFDTHFEELEAEYNRLKSEDELADRATLVQRIR